MSDRERTAATKGSHEQLREAASLVRHQEELQLGREAAGVGSVRVREQVESRNVEEVVPLQVEYVDEIEQTGPSDRDSGKVETLPDGSISIPILEEELVITKRTVVRERVVIRKRTETEQRRVEVELRKERVRIDADPGLAHSSETEFREEAP